MYFVGRISEANNYRFDSVEVKQLSFRLDGVFLPQNNNPQTPIYFCEVQFQEDEAFYQRFFTEIFLYLSKTDLTNDWRGVIVYPNPQVETDKVQRYRELLNSERVRRIYLNELENTPQTSIGLATVQLITLSILGSSAVNGLNREQIAQRIKYKMNVGWVEA